MGFQQKMDSLYQTLNKLLLRSELQRLKLEVGKTTTESFHTSCLKPHLYWWKSSCTQTNPLSQSSTQSSGKTER